MQRYLKEIGVRFAFETGGEADDSDHVTLCFVPKSEDPVPPNEVSAVVNRLAHALRDVDSFDVWIGGIAYFDTAERDGQNVTAAVALVDGPGLTDVYELVRDALYDFGWDWDPRHVSVFHTTLAYLPHGARVQNMPLIEATWTPDVVCLANEIAYRIPIGGWKQQRAARKQATLQGAGLLSFRTTPDTGHGNLYAYCSECKFRVPASGKAQYGCSMGDDPNVQADSAINAKDESTGNPPLVKCSGFQERPGLQNDAADDADADGTTDTSLIQATIRKISLEEGEERFFIWHSEPNACAICAPLDGVVFSMSDPLPHGQPGSVHKSCACRGEPIGWAEAVLRRDSGMVKEVPGEGDHHESREDAELAEIWSD